MYYGYYYGEIASSLTRTLTGEDIAFGEIPVNIS
jgi:hypothetical protein